MIDEYGTWSKGRLGDDNYIRLVIHRGEEPKNRSFFEAHRTDYSTKKRRFHTADVTVTDEDLRELRDHLNSLNL